MKKILQNFTPKLLEIAFQFLWRSLRPSKNMALATPLPMSHLPMSQEILIDSVLKEERDFFKTR
jgi:hypothetical protein